MTACPPGPAGQVIKCERTARGSKSVAYHHVSTPVLISKTNVCMSCRDVRGAEEGMTAEDVANMDDVIDEEVLEAGYAWNVWDQGFLDTAAEIKREQEDPSSVDHEKEKEELEAAHLHFETLREPVSPVIT